MIRKDIIALIASAVAVASGLLLILLEVKEPIVILLGCMIGGVYGLPIGLFIELKRRQWLVVFLLMLLIPASALFHWAVPLFLLVVTGATIYMASQIMSPLFDGSSKRAFQHLGKLNLGIWRGFQIIEDGETTFPQGAGRILGPTMTIVRANSVAILEGGKTQPRIIVGPKAEATEKFEYVKGMFNLKPKAEQKTLTRCLTADGIEIDITLNSLAGLNVSEQTRKDPSKITVFESTFLQKLYLDLPSWEDFFASVLEQATRREISKHRMLSLIGSTDYEAISQNIQSRVTARLKDWGIRTIELSLVKIAMPPTFVQTNADAVAARLATEILTVARHDGLIMMADGYNVAHQLGMPDDMINRELLRSALESILQTPGVGALLSPAVSAMLREVLESLRP